ncbi:phenylacetate--CoA ligase family protein [Acuticoccus sediminis]|uniref:phenylacetate--CoA ligase family protein n=1 Tax=Acuticoccus sediminis TaxID=2184697 RepID=UPI001CFE0733|nr:AMP-binding protein [Acuticoccus sediminis]
MADDLTFQTPEALTRVRDEVFGATLDRIFDCHPHYRALFAERGIRRADIAGVADLPRLPVTGKSDYVSNPAGFTLDLPASVDAEERIVWDVMYTTGSTGDPTPFTSTSYDFLNVLALNRNMLRLRGVTADDTILNLFPLTRHPHGAFARAMNAAAAYGIPVVAAMPGSPSPRHPDLGNRMDEVCALAGRSGATILWGVPSYIRKMLGRAEEMGVRLPSVRLVFVTGEGFGEEARRDLVERLKRLGAPDPRVSVSYGATEMQGGMVECVPGAGYHNPAPLQFAFEAVDPETHEPVADGEEGLILLTHLDRRGTTMLRYALGDTARLTRERCPHCGALTERLVSVPVRRDGFVKIKGMLVNPQALVDGLAAEAGIAAFQAYVDKEDAADALSMDRLVIRMCPRGVADDALVRRVADKVKATVGVSPVVELVAADDAALGGGNWKAKPIIDLRRRPD